MLLWLVIFLYHPFPTCSWVISLLFVTRRRCIAWCLWLAMESELALNRICARNIPSAGARRTCNSVEPGAKFKRSFKSTSPYVVCSSMNVQVGNRIFSVAKYVNSAASLHRKVEWLFYNLYTHHSWPFGPGPQKIWGRNYVTNYLIYGQEKGKVWSDSLGLVMVRNSTLHIPSSPKERFVHTYVSSDTYVYSWRS